MIEDFDAACDVIVQEEIRMCRLMLPWRYLPLLGLMVLCWLGYRPSGVE